MAANDAKYDSIWLRGRATVSIGQFAQQLHSPVPMCTDSRAECVVECHLYVVNDGMDTLYILFTTFRVTSHVLLQRFNRTVNASRSKHALDLQEHREGARL